MDNFGAGYFAGRRHERRRIARLLAGQRVPLPVGRPWITARGLRRLALLLVVLAVVLVVLFLAFCVVYGVQHHLIYPAGSR